MSNLLYQQIEAVIEAWLEVHPNPQGYVELVRAVHDFASKAIDKARREEAEEGKRLVSGAMGYMANQATEDDRHCGYGQSGCYRWVQEAKVFLGINDTGRARHGGGG